MRGRGRKLQPLQARGREGQEKPIGLPASMTVRKHISHSGHPICGILLQQSWQTNITGNTLLGRNICEGKSGGEQERVGRIFR